MFKDCKLHVILISWTIVLGSVVYFSYRAGVKSCRLPATNNTKGVVEQVFPAKTNDSMKKEAVADAQPEIIYTNHNPYGVTNEPTAPTKFTLTEKKTLTSIENYHWNNAKGSNSTGKIGLKDESGKTYGPWDTTGMPGQGGVPNAYWTAKIDLALDPGTYTITDSDEDTWSQNSQSQGQGMVKVYGK